jgi:hypothetical protein
MVLFEGVQFHNLLSLTFDNKILFIYDDILSRLNVGVTEFTQLYFEQIQVNVTKEKIKITWDKGEYEFPPEMFLITQERFKKAAGACEREERKKPITIQNKKQKPVTIFEL